MFVRPHLDYCDVIYHSPPISDPYTANVHLTSAMERIERTQYQAALSVTGCWQGTSRNKLYEELGWESLSDRRWARRLTCFYKIVHEISPAYLYEHVPALRLPIYGQLVSRGFHEIRCRTGKYMTSFFPHTVKTWNLIGEDFRSLDSLSKFKSSLLSLIRPPKKETYGIHNPTGIRYLFRLRLGLSSLKRHKYLHNFLDTSHDTCDCLQAPEYCFHFLFEYSLFRHFRGNFLQDVYLESVF